MATAEAPPGRHEQVAQREAEATRSQEELNEAALVLAKFQKWDLQKAGVIGERKLWQVLVQLGLPEEQASLLLQRAPFAKATADGVRTIDYADFLQWLFREARSGKLISGMEGDASSGGTRENDNIQLAQDSTGGSGSPEAAALRVLTLNLQYFSTYPVDAEGRKAGHEYLKKNFEETMPDVICVQEGLSLEGDDERPDEEKRNILGPLGYELQICSAQSGLAASVCDMVYEDKGVEMQCEKAKVDFRGKEGTTRDFLCNQIYLNTKSNWEVIDIINDTGAVKISSDKALENTDGDGRIRGPLAIRSMVWVKLRRRDGSGSHVYVMCTHISGGRFEDQYFVQQVYAERLLQTKRIIEFFMKKLEEDNADAASDFGIIVGDFNATDEYKSDGPMSGYFKAVIKGSAGVKADQEVAGWDADQLEDEFKKHMLGPFNAINEKGWHFAYEATDPSVNPTSAFGHTVDHMATSREMKVESVKKILLTNQKFSKGPKDVELELTDHNAICTTFVVP